MPQSCMVDHRRISSEVKTSLLPRRCYLSGKKLWLKRCRVIYTILTGPGDAIYETYWCDPAEFLLYELRRTN